MEAGATEDDVIDRLRVYTVLTGYTIHTWTEGLYDHVCRGGLYIFDTGKQESKLEKLKSILAQLEYKHQVMLWVSKGVPNNHLYVPEAHPMTGLGFCEREDEGHVFKVHSSKWQHTVLDFSFIYYMYIQFNVVDLSVSFYFSALVRA